MKSNRKNRGRAGFMGVSVVLLTTVPLLFTMPAYAQTNSTAFSILLGSTGSGSGSTGSTGSTAPSLATQLEQATLNTTAPTINVSTDKTPNNVAVTEYQPAPKQAIYTSVVNSSQTQGIVTGQVFDGSNPDTGVSTVQLNDSFDNNTWTAPVSGGSFTGGTITYPGSPELGQINSATSGNALTSTNQDTLGMGTGGTTPPPVTNYTVTYSANGVTGGTVPTAVAEPAGTLLQLAGAGSLVDSGYTFSGWNTAPDGSGLSYSAGSYIRITSNITLYAQWTANVVTPPVTNYTVTYDGNGSTGGTAPASVTDPSGSSVNVAGVGSLVDSGYTFAGWNTAADGSGTSYSAGQGIYLSSNITLYAQWTAVSVTNYTVTYSANGSTSGTAPTSVTDPSGSSVNVASQGSLVDSGYTFAGWNTAADGSGTSYNAGSTLNLTGNVTLYAQWTANNYTLTYNGNGAALGTVPTAITAPSGTNETITGAGSLENIGYTFSGWNTSADGSGTSYSVGSTLDLIANTTLYAQWTAAPAGTTYTSSPLQDAPIYVTYDPVNNYLYVSSWSMGAVSVVNPTTLQVVASIPFSGAAAITYGNGYIYVGSQITGNNAVGVIDPTTNTMIATIPVPVGTDAESILYFNGYVYVGNGYATGLGTAYFATTIIDASTNQVVTSITQTNGGIDGLTTDGSNVYALGTDPFGHGMLETISNNTVVNTVYQQAYYQASTYANGYIYSVNDGGNGEAYVVNPSTGAIITTIALPEQPIAITYGGGYLYVADFNFNSGEVSVIDPTTNTIVATIPVGNQPLSLVYANGYVYVANYGSQTISVIKAY